MCYPLSRHPRKKERKKDTPKKERKKESQYGIGGFRKNLVTFRLSEKAKILKGVKVATHKIQTDLDNAIRICLS